MYKKHEIGKLGEDLATKYLYSINYKIIDRNFSCRQGEIDIIARDGNELVFIEVKTRTNSCYGKPAEAVNYIKQQHIEKVAKYYIYKNHLENEYIRFDIVEVYISNNKNIINHIKQVIVTG